MAYGIELILGFPFEKWGDIPKSFIKFEESVCAIDLLHEAHKKACAEMGFKFIGRWKTNPDYDVYVTPLGDRITAPFRLEKHLDESEMCETEKEAVIGISVSGRYFPTFLDWRDPHGTLYNIVFDDEMKKDMAIARKHIVEALPIMEKAVWIVKQKHY